MTKQNMTAKLALEILQNAVVAADYLENVAQSNVNADGRVIADTVNQGDDVDGRSIFGNWKIKTNTTKFGKACVKMIEFAEGTVAYEAKQLAHETTATKSGLTKELPAPVKK